MSNHFTGLNSGLPKATPASTSLIFTSLNPPTTL